MLAESHTSDTSRRIIHVDMDAFYAAVEQRDDPTLRGRPIAVGSSGRRGVVLTASYEARRYGVHSAMPSFEAARLCPDLQFVRPRFPAYKEASRRIRAIFARHTSLIEPLSLDEAYLDVTDRVQAPRTTTGIAREIKNAISAELGLTASAGVSFNKLLAKLASDMEKPDGLTVIRPERAMALLSALPVERFHGVGPSTARRLHAAGIALGRDLQACDEPTLVKLLGKAGSHFWRLARGIDSREVRTDRQRLSLSVETTFFGDITDPQSLGSALDQLCRDMIERCRSSGFLGRTLTLKIKYADFRVRSRSQTLPRHPQSAEETIDLALGLLRRSPLEAPVRLLGIGLSRQLLEPDEAQLALPLDAGDLTKPQG